MPSRSRTPSLALNADSYDAKTQAVDQLAALRDDRAIPILAAMAEGGLFVRESDGAAGDRRQAGAGLSV